MSENPVASIDIGLQWGFWKWNVSSYTWVGGGEGGVPPQPPPQESWQTKYDNHFTSDPTSAFTVLEGTWAWQSPTEYKATGTGRNSVKYTTTGVGSVKFYIEAKGKCNETSGDNNMAIAYFIQDADNLFAVGYNAVLDRFFIMKRVAAVETTLTKQDSVLAGGHGVSLTIYVEYNPTTHIATAELYSGTTLLSTLTTSDTTFTSGGFGFFSYKTALFDYLTVKEVAISGFDFTFVITPTSKSIIQGNTSTVTYACSLSSGTAQSVSITCTNKPANVTVTPSPSSGLPNFNGSISIAVGGTVPTGTYTITMQASGGGQTHNQNITLTVGSSTESFSDAFTDGSKDPHWNLFNYQASANYFTIAETAEGLTLTSSVSLLNEWAYAGYISASTHAFIDGTMMECTIVGDSIDIDQMVGLVTQSCAGSGASEISFGDGYFWYKSRNGIIYFYRRLAGELTTLFSVVSATGHKCKIALTGGNVVASLDDVQKYSGVFALGTRNLYAIIRVLTDHGSKHVHITPYAEQIP